VDTCNSLYIGCIDSEADDDDDDDDDVDDDDDNSGPLMDGSKIFTFKRTATRFRYIRVPYEF